MPRRRPLAGFIAVIQSVLFLTHLLIYETWTFFPDHGTLWIKLVLGFLSITFVSASLLAFRYTNSVVRVFYRAAAVWAGLLGFLFFAAIASWRFFGFRW